MLAIAERDGQRCGGPVLLIPLAMALLLPSWLERVERLGLKAWRQSVPAAALTGSLLQLLFLSATATGALLAAASFAWRAGLAPHPSDWQTLGAEDPEADAASPDLGNRACR